MRESSGGGGGEERGWQSCDQQKERDLKGEGSSKNRGQLR